jgi:hypothetical protein
MIDTAMEHVSYLLDYELLAGLAGWVLLTYTLFLGRGRPVRAFFCAVFLGLGLAMMMTIGVFEAAMILPGQNFS